MSSAVTPIVLPTYVVPERYDLDLQPDLENFTFSGVCVISYKVNASELNDSNNTKIVLHAKELSFTSAEFVIGDGKPVEAREIIVNLKETTVTFLFSQPIPPDAQALTLKIHYSGFLNNQMAGFYRSGYTDISGQPKIMASTQFESLDARRAFPCVDEPAAKATFVVKMTIPSHLQCISNMPEAMVESLTSTLKKVTFLESPKMSTYLAAWVVGEFDCVQAQTTNGVLVKVYTPPGKSSSGTFALECGVKALDLYDDFFQIPFPLPKLDMIAIPEFAMGAMENFGCVTYREVDLLIDPVTASSSQKQRVATVVTHELAHQWFGNLVTMAWWDDLWLNEGFASWCENMCSDALFPEYKYWDQFTIDHLAYALRMDALKSSHPIQVPMAHAEEVEQNFDGISYMKGATVVRMIRAVLGAQRFQEGLIQYMKKHAYGNATTKDLWCAWEDVSGVPVQTMMATWTEQMGFPLLHVTKEEWHDDKVILDVEQSWFLSDGSELDAKGQARKWTIPILACTEDGPLDDFFMMSDKTATITIPVKQGGWVKLNAGQQVLMRVLPGSEMLLRLQAAVADKTLDKIDRAAVIGDAFALVKAGHMSPETVIELLGAYKNEDEYIVWAGIGDALKLFQKVMADDKKMSSNFRAFARKIVLSLVKKVGWDAQPTDGHTTNLLRGLAMSLLASFAADDEATAKEASRRFQAFLADANDVVHLPPDIRTQVFKIVLSNGGAKEFDEVKSYFSTADNNAERKHVFASLGSAPNEKLKLKALDWCTSGEVKLQDFFYVIGGVNGSGTEGRDLTWQYYQDNFDKIKGMIGKGSASLMDAAIVFSSAGYSSAAKAAEIQKFFEDHPLPDNTRKIAQVIEGIETNAKFFQTLQGSQLTDDGFWSKLA